MSTHWQPDSDRTRWTRADGCASPGAKPWRAKSWPRGATAGVALVAAGCLAIAMLLYRVAGPRDVVEDNAAINWNNVTLPAPDSQD